MDNKLIRNDIDIEYIIEGLLAKFDLSSVNEEIRNMIYELLHIFYHSEDGIYVVDGDGISLRANPAFEEIAGVKVEELFNQDVKQLVKKGIFSRSAAAEAIEEKKVKTIVQEYANGKIGLVTSTPIKNHNGDVIRVISNIRDITELSKLYETLSAKERLIQKYSKILGETNLLETNGIVAESESMLNTIKMARRVAEVDSNAIILGESGVGKGMIAKLIASMSNRFDKPFIAVNCSAIPEQLMESELFGYVEGAFTGANKGGKAGLVEAADGGILFLDEIGEMPLSLQPKLLTFLESKEITKVGATKAKSLNVRILTATNKNLLEMVKRGRFREDLYYRLNVIPITISPLRERREDILHITDHLLEMFNNRYKRNRKISNDVMNVFLDYSWPGNVRQLKNALERMVILSSDDIITVRDLPREILCANENDREILATAMEEMILPMSMPDKVMELESKLIEEALKRGGSIRNAAKLLGITSSALFRKLKKQNKCVKIETNRIEIETNRA